MNKHLLKQTIIYLNEFSLDDDHDLVSQTVREIKRQDPSMSEGDVIKVIHLLQKIHALEWLWTCFLQQSSSQKRTLTQM